MEARISADFQGIQLDVIGGVSAPGATTMFFQVDKWAAMANWVTADTWCVSDVYDWTITDATSPTEFTIEYVRSEVFPDCADQDYNQQFALHITGGREEDGRMIYDGTYEFPGGTEFQAVRTVCSLTWDDPDRCGVDTPGLEVPAPPAL
jgi:hypothetical protein